MPPKVDPSEVRFSIILSIQSTLKYSVEKQDQLLPSPLSWVLSVSMPKRLVRISSRKDPSGRVSEWWFSLNAKTELLKSPLIPVHPHFSLKSSAITRETERKSKMLIIKEISLWSKSKRLRKSLKRRVWLRTLQEQSSKSLALVFLWAQQWTSKAPSKSLLKSTMEN